MAARGKERCTLLMHPSDADDRGLVTGDVAVVESRVGRVAAPIEVTDDMRLGVVCLPYGWGHDAPGARLRIAEATRRQHQHPRRRRRVRPDLGQCGAERDPGHRVIRVYADRVR